MVREVLSEVELLALDPDWGEGAANESDRPLRGLRSLNMIDTEGDWEQSVLFLVL